MIRMLEIPEPTPSLNAILRMHWSSRIKFGERWELLLLEARAHFMPAARRKRFVRITRVASRLLDLDNLWGGAKIPIDAMKKLGIVVDDSPRWLKLSVVQRKGTPARTEIEIRDRS